MLRRRIAASRNDEGSLLLAMFAIMIVTALAAVITATVVTGQKQSTNDQRFEQALEVAEVGLGQMNSLIQNNPGTTTFPAMTGTTSDGGTYSVSAVKSTYTWKVTAVGTSYGGLTRTVTNDLAVRPLFAMAAFGKLAVTFRGGNGADSYNSSLNSDICQGTPSINNSPSANYLDPGSATNAGTNSSQTDVRMCQPTSLGDVGTNGDLYLLGTVADRIDRADIYNARDHVLDPFPDATGNCAGVTATCDLYNTGRLGYTRDPIPFPAVSACSFPAGSAAVPSSGGGTFGGRAYNLSDVTLDGSSVFTGTAAQPTILCISGTLNVAAQSLINFTTGTTFEQPTTILGPASLLIFVTGSSNSGVVLGDHASLSAAVYAPNAAVSCGPQGNIYGSLIANTITNGGGWNFHYDDALKDQMANAPVRVSNWVEVH